MFSYLAGIVQKFEDLEAADIYWCCIQDEIYLNLVLEFIPETVYKVARQFSKQKQVLILISIDWLSND